MCIEKGLVNFKNDRPLFLNIAFKYLSFKPRSIFETRTHLENKGCPEKEIESIIKTLLEKQFLDDRMFAERYIDSRIKNTPRSKFAMQYELKQKGISSSISEPLLSKFDDLDLANAALQTKIRRWKTLSEDDFKKKVMNYLRYRGFSYSTSVTAFEQQINHQE